MNYPLQELENISRKLQEYLTEYRKENDAMLDFNITHEKKGEIIVNSMNNLKEKAGIELLPNIHRVIGEIEALLGREDKTVVERVLPLLTELKRSAESPVNSFDFSKISAQLMLLAGHLTQGAVMKPKVFVGHSFSPAHVATVQKFMELFGLEGLDCYTGRSARPMDIDEKVKLLINQSDGVIIIFSPEKKNDSEYNETPRWLDGELNYSMGRDKPYLMFYDERIDPNERQKGLQGNFEYIAFDSKCLDRAFLMAIPYIRIFRDKIVTNQRDNGLSSSH